MEKQYTRIRVERPASGVSRIILARAQKRNAQDPQMLYELDDAFSSAAQDAAVRVIILAADGPDFSSGHDLAAGFTMPGRPTATLESGFGAEGIEGHLAFECEAYLGLCRRWRDIPKPTIAQVQGRVIGGGLMLIWPLDLIVAAESAQFSDPVAAFGVNGGEYFVHPWELGARKAKELLFTGESISAREASALGMLNRVVPDDELEAATLALAELVATRPPIALRLVKRSVNGAVDAQGQAAAIDHAFALHHVGHANNLIRYGELIDPAGADLVRRSLRKT